MHRLAAALVALFFQAKSLGDSPVTNPPLPDYSMVPQQFGPFVWLVGVVVFFMIVLSTTLVSGILVILWKAANRACDTFDQHQKSDIEEKKENNNIAKLSLVEIRKLNDSTISHGGLLDEIARNTKLVGDACRSSHEELRKKMQGGK